MSSADKKLNNSLEQREMSFCKVKRKVVLKPNTEGHHREQLVKLIHAR